MTTFTTALPPPGDALAAHLRRHAFVLARIRSLLEQGAAASAGHEVSRTARDDDMQPEGLPKTQDALLERAQTLARSIDAIERDTRAGELAKLLHIPKANAQARLAAPPGPTPASATRTQPPATAAARIEQLEARARDVLAQRRRRLAQLQQGTTLAAGASAGAAGRTGRGGPHDKGDADAADGAKAGPAGHGAPARGVSGGASLSALLDRIDGFTHPDLPARETDAYADWRAHDVFKRGDGRIPDVAAGRMVKGAGRIIGPGGAYADRVYVNRWYLIGPFDGKHVAGLFANDRYPPEQGVALDAAYRGKGGRLLRWTYVDMDRYPLIPPDEAEDAVYYGYTEVMVDKDEDLTAWVGADDDAQLWLNNRLVWPGGSVDKGWFFERIYGTYDDDVRNYNLSEGRRTVHFRKGRNTLFFKLSNGPTRLFFSLVLTK